jgi:hypothetical protein
MPDYQDLWVPAALIVFIFLIVLGVLRSLRRTIKQPTRESWLRWRACTRKRAYSTKREARVVVARHKREGDIVAVYQCRWCRRWHVGHSQSLRRG